MITKFPHILSSDLLSTQCELAGHMITTAKAGLEQLKTATELTKAFPHSKDSNELLNGAIEIAPENIIAKRRSWSLWICSGNSSDISLPSL